MDMDIDNDSKSKIYSIDIPLNKSNNFSNCSFGLIFSIVSDYCVCCASGFKTDYPPALRNYIEPNEFQQSITNINNKYPRAFYPCLVFVAILFVTAVALTAVGIILMVVGFQGRKKSDFETIIVSCIFLILGFLTCFCCCRCFIKQVQSTEPMKQTIEEESKKYEERYCQWRLIAKRDEPNIFVSKRHQPKKFHVSRTSRLIRFVLYIFNFFR
jgi:hypothetical protein